MSDWSTCRKGSCHRHEQCMYVPCRSVAPIEAGTAETRRGSVRSTKAGLAPEINGMTERVG